MSQINRRLFLASAASLAAVTSIEGVARAAKVGTTATSPSTTPANEHVPDDVVWHDVSSWGVEGKGFTDTERYYDRLPARAKGVVRDPVWKLSRDSAGMSARFEAETPAIYIRYELNSPTLAMSHMAASGVSGFDLYSRVGNTWRWTATRRPAEVSFAGTLVKEIRPGKRMYQVNLPLYNGVKSLDIGIPGGAYFNPIAPRTEKPILFYGTSITQGGCASRPGMAFVSILGRRLDRPMLNFGFSGNGVFELEVGRFLVELDPALFVIDCVGNSTAAQITERAEPLVKLVREHHPNTPILMLDCRLLSNAHTIASPEMDPNPRNAAQHEAYKRLKASGMKHLYYRDSGDLIGNDDEATVDGSHPTDLGMMRFADALEPDIRSVLAEI